MREAGSVSRRTAYAFALVNFILMVVSIVVAAAGGTGLLYLFAVAWAAFGVLWLWRARSR